MSDTRFPILLPVLWFLLVSASAYVEELDDSFMANKGPDDIWLIKFYAPWCTFCKQLDPVWHEIGSELRSHGSMVQVGKSDATVNTGLAKEFRVHNYPAIFMLKKDVKFTYLGPKTKDKIMEYADRVGGPLVRSLKSPQLFQHAMSRHEVMFVYVGATSPLKGNFTSAAEELVAHSYFFSAGRDVLPASVSLAFLPAVVVFKEGTFFSYTEEEDGDLKSWIKKERFPNFLKIDAYTLYVMGESGKLVVLVLMEERFQSAASLRFKNLVEKVAAEHRETYSKNFYFGFMAGSEYIKGYVMGDVPIPSLMVLNLSNDGYYLPPSPVETEDHLLDFLDGVLEGSVEALGGNSVPQRVRRLIYDAKTTLTPIFRDAPVLGCFLVGFPVSIAAVFLYLCLKHRPGLDGEEDAQTTSANTKKLSSKKSN